MQKPDLDEAELKATHRNIEVHHRADNTWHTRHKKTRTALMRLPAERKQALLFGMVSIAEGIDASEDTFLPQVCCPCPVPPTDN